MSSFLCEGFLQLRQAGVTLHRGARASHYRGLSCRGAQAPDAQAQQLWLMGLVAPRHVGSSQTRARTRVPCIGRQTLNHCTTREAPELVFKRKVFIGHVTWRSSTNAGFSVALSWHPNLITKNPVLTSCHSVFHVAAFTLIPTLFLVGRLPIMPGASFFPIYIQRGNESLSPNIQHRFWVSLSLDTQKSPPLPHSCTRGISDAD